MKNDGGTAFPTAGSSDWTTGMTLRDYFAAKAMASLCSHERNMIAIAANQGAREEIAEDAYGMADAMLAEQEKKLWIKT